MKSAHISFDRDLATVYGINAAIIHQYIAWWVMHNKESGKNLHDNRYWTYNTLTTMQGVFSFMKPRSVRTALELLERECLISVGHYSKNKSDRTKWYTINADSGKIDDMTETAEAYDGNGRSIIQLKDTAIDSVGTEKVPTLDSNKSKLIKLRADNEKMLRHLPKTVRGKTITFNEGYSVFRIMTIYNTVRSLYKDIDSNVSPNLKACTQAVELIRDDVDIENIDEVFHNMFEDKFAKEKNWDYLTPEFVTRTDKFQKYQ